MGSVGQFLVTVFISALFDFIGYFMTSILATSHAAKQGSRAGLGLTFIRIGLLLKFRKDSMGRRGGHHGGSYQTGPGLPPQEVLDQQAEWISILFIAMGAFIMAKANGDFIRSLYLRRLLLSSSSPEFTL